MSGAIVDGINFTVLGAFLFEERVENGGESLLAPDLDLL